MFRLRIVVVAAALATAVLPGLAACSDAPPVTAAATGRHVLLISVDGMHEFDLERYVAGHPNSALAGLAATGTAYTAAQTPVPSDSFPGTLAEMTGGTPASTGVYYDSSYDRSLLPPGTTSCAGVSPGTAAVLDETIDRNPAALDAGQGLPNLPSGIFAMTGTPRDVIDPAKLPVDPATCRPVYPHSFERATTVFEVAHAHGLRTAWSDKHPAYDLLSGPSGTGIDDEFSPEIAGDGDQTKDNLATRNYDAIKVAAVRNEIDGFDHSRTASVGTPAILGLNFQSVSTAEKLPTSDGQTGGYLPGGAQPGPLLSGALDFVDAQIGSLVSELRAQHLDTNTTVVLTAKHGQSPTDPTLLNRVDDGPILDGLDAAWTAAHPGAPKLVAHSADDDGMYLWLTDRSPAATAFAADYLRAQAGSGTDATGAKRPFTSSGLAQVFAGADAAGFLHVSPSDTRVPDVVGVVAPGTVYTGGTSKNSEHGGALPTSRDVPVLVAGPGGASAPRTNASAVSTTQIAPTILRSLGLDPTELSAVRSEGTPPLPGT